MSLFTSFLTAREKHLFKRAGHPRQPYASRGRRRARLFIEPLEVRQFLSTTVVGPVTVTPPVGIAVGSHFFDTNNAPGNWYPNGASTVNVPKFDDMGGTRVLESVKVEYSISAIQEYINYNPQTGTGTAGEFISNADTTKDYVVKSDPNISNPDPNLAARGEAVLSMNTQGALDATDVFGATGQAVADTQLKQGTSTLSVKLNPQGSGEVDSSINPALTLHTNSAAAPTTATINGLDLETTSGSATFTRTANSGEVAAFIGSSGNVSFTVNGTGSDLLLRTTTGSFIDNGGLQTANRANITVTYVWGVPKAKISITPDAVNEVGKPHTFTIHVQQDDGLDANEGGDGVTGFVDSTVGNVDLTLTDSNGASSVLDTAASTTDDNQPSGDNLDNNGEAKGVFTSASAGIVKGHATASVTVLGVPLTVSTDGLNGDSGDATKRFVDARITIAPNATNTVGQPHTFTATVQEDDGLTAAQGGDGVTGFANVVGAATTITLTNGGGAVATPAGPVSGTTNASGQLQATFTSNTPGTVTGNASTTFTLDGVTLTRDTDPATANIGAGPGGSGPAIKTFIPPAGGGATATMGFWHNKNGQAVIKSASTIGADLAGKYPHLFGAGAAAFDLNGAVKFMNLTVQSASNVAAYFLKLFNVTGPHTYAQVMSNVLAAYFDNINNTSKSQQFGFGGDLLGTQITLTSGQATLLGLSSPTTVSQYLDKVDQLMTGKGGVIPSGLFITLNDVSDKINNLNDI